MSFFSSLDQKHVEELAPVTLSHSFINVGDIVYMPAGAIFCEKAVSAHNLVLRAPSTLLCAENSQSCSLVAGACGVKSLG